jgi:hypothetical protein
LNAKNFLLAFLVVVARDTVPNSRAAIAIAIKACRNDPNLAGFKLNRNPHWRAWLNDGKWFTCDTGEREGRVCNGPSVSIEKSTGKAGSCEITITNGDYIRP